ncbi:MAG: sulfate adenylyltransferase [Dehalococcoidia bacterium]|nr:sulfate adenylyltransferase [Dehalococcoidia bacterium]|tara:strand:- start:7051 stop:8313 length:1263 start_codon:yes stop_codon:yes gene_type:complete
MDLIRIATAGSVDDGKSTLIGRLLLDSNSLNDDTLAAVEDVSQRQRGDYVNLALITDGLRAEREQGITIDVAYRYFSTNTRKFILADTPGHVQYTRNMVTGASTAEVALIMIDARNGLVEQSRRHYVIASLLGITHIIVCVNKMDLVGYNEEIFNQIRADFDEFLTKDIASNIVFIPMSALNGDNVVDPSINMPWYSGDPLLHVLEHISVRQDLGNLPLRMPIQIVIRPMLNKYHDYRAYAGSIASGTLSVGQRVQILPSGQESVITNIDAPWGPVEKASSPDSVTVRIADDFDIARGETICGADELPQMKHNVDAVICWMDDRSSMNQGDIYRIKHGPRLSKTIVTSVNARFNIASLDKEKDAISLKLNEVGHVSLKVSDPLVCDDYALNRATGSFILIDESTNSTVAAGMIGDPKIVT